MWKTNHIVKLDVREMHKMVYSRSPNKYRKIKEKPNPNAQAQENQTYEKKYLSSRQNKVKERPTLQVVKSERK